MAGRPLPDRTYPAETGSAGYTLHEKTLGQWLEYWAETTPDKEYIVYSDRDLRFTWSKFNERVDNLAKGLIAIGVKRGSNVGIWATNVPDWLTFLYATAKIGAVLVTVNTNYKQNELEYLCKDSDMHTLCITDGTWDCNYVDMTYTMLPELKTCERGHLNSERFPYLKNVVYIGMEKYRGMFNTAELLLLGQNIEDETLLEMKSKVTCHDVCNMQYTSGTTGFPKGVMLTHYGIANDGYFTGENMGFTQDDKLCVCVPLFHCFGVVLATMNCLTHGCTEVMVEKFDPLVVLASIHKERCTAVYGVPNDVHCRTESPDVRYVRPDLSAYGYHGRIALSCGTDETGEREDVYDHHIGLWTHREFAGYDSDLSERYLRAALHHRWSRLPLRGGQGAGSRNRKGMSCGCSGRDVLQGLQRDEGIL